MTNGYHNPVFYLIHLKILAKDEIGMKRGDFRNLLFDSESKAIDDQTQASLKNDQGKRPIPKPFIA